MKDFYIYGRPIQTKIGNLHFLTVEEYYDFIFNGHLGYLTFQKDDLLQKLKEIEKMDEGVKPIVESLEELDLFEFIKLMGSFGSDNLHEQSYIKLLHLDNLHVEFSKLFEFCFKEDVFDKIESNEEFESYRELILEINCIPYEKPNPNPEIEKFKRYERLLQQRKGDSMDFESMYTSVWVGVGQCPDELTMYKFNKLFERIAQFKNYDTSTLFATVSSDAKIESWYKVVEGKEKEEYITEQKLMNMSQKNL